MVRFIGPEAEPRFDWIALTEALEAGHLLPQAQVKDVLLYRGKETLLNRSAWIDGMGVAVKAATIYPGNTARGIPNLHGAVSLFADGDGRLEAIIDFALETKWKTAGDSLLAARKLARPDSRRILLVGAGVVAASMVDAYSALFPHAEFMVWARRPGAARDFAARHGAAAVTDLKAAVAEADIIATATMATEPVVRGEWLKPGTHLDLIGAYTPAMREVDSDCFRRASVFVDSRLTTVDHIGDVIEPIREGAISAADIRADFYDLASGAFGRTHDDEITLCKNGGGAHLDLMTARYILQAVRG
ncbi:MAG: ornithine cyclodeaminase family protein [Pseudomonadota bacterium]